MGITFEPVPTRTLPDVRGTIWFDARSFELRLVEFRYTLLEPFEGSDRVGGEVHFGKLSNGAWVVSRWFMRFPQFARPVAPVDAYSTIPSVIVRPTMHRLVEEGGMVFTAGLKLYARPASVAGFVLDSAGRPFAGTSIRLGGTPYTTQSGPDGSFRFDSMPAGRFSLIVEHQAYKQVGSYVAIETVELTEGATASMTLRAAKTAEIVEKLCEGKMPKKDNGTLRVQVIDAMTSRPLASLRVWLRWAGRYSGTMEHPEFLRPTALGGLESLTDASGNVTFCDLPADVKLVFSAVKPDGKPASDSTDLRVSKSELKVSTVATRRPQ